MSKQYCGYISIIGKPNVGKSSILNAILERKISITSRKSQTTRNNILGIKTVKNKQMIFIDTPGMHANSKKTMNKILNKSAQSMIDDSDLVLFILQRLSIGNEDKLIIEKLRSLDQKVICVVNKIDQIENKNKLLPLMEELSSNYNFSEIALVSAKTKDGITDLIKIIQNNIPENNHLFDENENNEVFSSSSKFMISELIREKIIRKLGDELPHDTFVEIESVSQKNKIFEIHATIFVNRKSQKQIVIGSGGEVLKTIGKTSRLEIEKYLNKKVFLKTWVKVKKNWNTDSEFIHSLGVGGNYEPK
ncbi:MAG: GTPase Era [Gammaproteobacteria bacterium]|nr:GTPase Era [Gammaproteobacteria bacterium]|tara:strand:- start:5292 stop:6206 length:915 start_codon:yes stop_codon:yes gene_type:complete